MRFRRYGNVSFQKRRYRKSPKCRYCGVRNPDAFYPQYKSICKGCKKLRAVNRQRAVFVSQVAAAHHKVEA
jgi:hypothetical protein